MDLYVYPIQNNFEVGDKVIDKTAGANGWPDVRGEVIEVDGSHVHVRYNSGTERWKMHIHLELEK